MAYDPPKDLDDAIARFDDWSSRLLGARDWQSQQPLYHYTSFETLPKILKSQQLWMTSLFNQPKDPQEFVFGSSILKLTIQENARDASSSYMHTRLFNRLEGLAHSDIRKFWGCHIACLAPHGEDFDLWKEFGDGGKGVALKISADYFVPRPHGNDEPKWSVQPVTYGPDVAAHALRKVIQIASMALAEAEPFVKSQADADYVVDRIFESLAACHVIPICMLAKNGNFIAEAEVRMFAPSSLERELGPPDKIAAHLHHNFIEGVLVGENADAEHARQIVAGFALSPALVQVAAYSRGLQPV
ncbi:hypothetical protein [Solirhodobacter olei]|uniref:hypothetical protein n=1 Tax=Solirhodobacter olei TaxID=2493082 RepID=UPI000FDA2A32|nr:hypothetical protein [Solirhodobacter olei]